MATLQWSLTCRDIVVDKNSNNISYRDAIEELTAQDLPTALPPLLIVAMLWRRDDLDTPERFETRIVIRDDEGNQIGLSDPTPVDLSNHARFRAHIQNPLINIQEPGTLWFVIEKRDNSDWEEVTQLPIEIKTVPDTNDTEGQRENGAVEAQ